MDTMTHQFWKTEDGGFNWIKINDIGYVELSFPTEDIGRWPDYWRVHTKRRTEDCYGLL